VAILAVAVSACSPDEPLGSPPASPDPGAAPEVTDAPSGPRVRFGDHVVSVEVADDDYERVRGLMDRRRLGADDGMLFVFPSRTTGFFWMKNTLIPLSIAFLRRHDGRELRVVEILDMEPCRAANPDADCPRYRSQTSYDFALEVNQGWFRRSGVSEGDRAMVEGPVPTLTGPSPT
jgi:uncharacterized membrane protein (UPF0127 family)